MDPALYPFDVQQYSIQISTPGMSKDLLALVIDEWMFKNGQQQWKENKTTMGYNETNVQVLHNVFYDANPAWDFLGYKFDDIDITGNDEKLYSRVQGTVLQFSQINLEIAKRSEDKRAKQSFASKNTLCRFLEMDIFPHLGLIKSQTGTK